MYSSVYVKCHYEKEQRIFIIILTKISNEDQEGLDNRIIIVVLIMYEGTFSKSTLYA